MIGRSFEDQKALQPSDDEVLWCWREAQQVARQALPRGQIDHEGRDSDDYATLLLLKAWSAVWRYRTRHRKGLTSVQLDAERRYVHKALHNERRSLQRESVRRGALRAALERESMSDPSNRLSARFTLQVLQASLPAYDFRLLMKVGLAGGVIREANDVGMKERTFYAQVARARAKARQVERGTYDRASRAD